MGNSSACPGFSFQKGRHPVVTSYLYMLLVGDMIFDSLFRVCGVAWRLSM